VSVLIDVLSHRATEKDLKYLTEQAGIRTIIDLRGKDEIKALSCVLLDEDFATITLKPSTGPLLAPKVLRTSPPKRSFSDPNPSTTRGSFSSLGFER